MIIINGQSRKVYSEEGVIVCIDYDEVVRRSEVRPDGFPTVTYSRGVLGASGTLIHGGDVELADGMIFSVAHTGSA